MSIMWHYNLGRALYIIMIWTQIICWPMALILNEYNSIFVALAMLILYFLFVRTIKAKCHNCFSGKYNRKPISTWDKELWVKRHYTRYSSNVCAAIKDFDENYRGIIIHWSYIKHALVVKVKFQLANMRSHYVVRLHSYVPIVIK